MPPASNNDAEKTTFLSQTPAPRPLVPPGFASTVLERNLGAKSLSHPHDVEVGSSELDENILHAKSKLVLNGTSDNQVEKQSAEQVVLGKQQHGSASTHASVDSMSEKNPNLSPPQGTYNKMIGIDSQIYDTSNTSQTLDEMFGSSEVTSEDRAEEERKRRASFELMRKEQQKAFQEKQKLKPEKNKGDFDFATLLDDSKDEKRLLHRSSEIEEPHTSRLLSSKPHISRPSFMKQVVAQHTNASNP